MSNGSSPRNSSFNAINEEVHVMTAPASASQLEIGSSYCEDAIGSNDRFGGFTHSVVEPHGRRFENTAPAATPDAAASRIATLTVRQREILEHVLAGQPSKIIAADLGISQRTVDNHRAAIMRKTASKSIPALVRTALAAGMHV